MGLFSDIISGIGNGISDLFGGGGNNDQKKRQQQQPQAPASVSPPIGGFNRSPVQLPAVFQAAQQQQQQNPLHLFTPNQQPNPLQPPQPQQQQAPQTNVQNYAQPQDHPSLFGQLLHGAGGVVRSVAQPFVNVGEDVSNGIGNAEVGAAHLLGLAPNVKTQTNQQQFGDINNSVGLKTEDNTPKNFLLNTAQVAGTVLAPEADAAAEAGAQAALNPETANTAIQLARMGLHQASDDVLNNGLRSAVINTAGRVGANAAIGGGFNAVNGIQQGENPGQVLKDFGTGALFGGGTGAATGVLPIIKGARALTDDETAGVAGEKAPVESGVKSPAEATNSPAGEKNAPPEKAPGAAETGIKSPPAVTEPASTVEAPAPGALTTTPALTKTGDDTQDLHNVLSLVADRLTNGRDFTPEGGGKGLVQHVIDLLNARPGDTVAGHLNSRMGAALSNTEQQNIRKAIETGSTKGLSDKEKAVHDALQTIESSSSDVRSKESSDYQAVQNHFPQVREVSARGAAKGAALSKGLPNKVEIYNDLLNQNSRFSEGSTLGTFTRNGKSITGDANDLGLVPKKNGTFVDKAGNVYQYSRATSQDLENAGAKIQAPKDAFSTYVKDTLALKDRADARDFLIKNADEAGLSEKPVAGRQAVVTLKDSSGEEHNFYTDKKTAKAISKSPISSFFSGEPNLATKLANKATSLVTQLTVGNPTVHGENLAANAYVSTGAKSLSHLTGELDPATELRMADKGVYAPSYGKNNVNTIAKFTHGATKLNEAALANIDHRIRYGMFKTLTEDKGLSDAQAAKQINQWMGGKEVYKGNNFQLGMFWNYFLRQNVNAGRVLAQAAKGNVAPLIRAGIAAGTVAAANYGEQKLTGNNQAYVRPPGVLGAGNDVLKSVESVRNGQYRAAVNPIVNHINPLISQAAEQILGVDPYGNKFANGQERVNNLLSMTPETNLLNDNGHSAAEKGLNTFGIYTPHIKGDMAVSPTAPGASVLNVKDALNGSTKAFPNDFTGEQTSKAVNDFVNATGGKDYTYKNAATIASQTPEQRQAFTTNTKALETAGVSSQTAPTYAKDMMNMSKSDQADYLKAIKDVNTSTDGTTLSASSIESQLAKNGNIPLAASLNKGISSSLSQQDKNTLETYKLKGETYLEDNTNAYNYYMADINNKNALGTLTTGPDKDTDMGTAFSGTGGTLYVKAAVAKTNAENNVPQSLQDLYYHTTKTQYDKGEISAADSAALTKYVQELNANGVIDKFGLATGTSGSSGGGSSSTSAAAVDRAAGIPYGTISGSFVKPIADPGLQLTSPKPFQAPKLAKYTPDAKANPFVRSISVSSRVK